MYVLSPALIWLFYLQVNGHANLEMGRMIQEYKVQYPIQSAHTVSLTSWELNDKWLDNALYPCQQKLQHTWSRHCATKQAQLRVSFICDIQLDDSRRDSHLSIDRVVSLQAVKQTMQHTTHLQAHFIQGFAWNLGILNLRLLTD